MALVFNSLNTTWSPVLKFVIITTEVSITYKETVMTFVNELFQHSPREDVENYENLCHDL
jgi:hypothetical protein